MTTHALLSPSSSNRWLECTPSAMLEKDEPNISSPFAEEGTDAHSLAEIKLSHILGKINNEQYSIKLDEFIKTSKFYNIEFNDYVNDYVSEVMMIITVDHKDAILRTELEEQVEFSDIVPSGRGISDVVIVGKDFIHIIDLKFGKGIPVSAIGNSQLRLYALGAVKKYIRECVCNKVIMTIIQPRLNDITTDYMTIAELNDWAINYVKPRADLAIVGQGKLVPGDHCKFCKCRGKCKVLGENQLQLAQKEFDTVIVDNTILEPSNMTPETLSRVMTIAPKFIDWFKEVQSYVTKSMINDGIKVPGYKIVEGRSVRIMTDPDAIVEKLKSSGFDEFDYMEPAKILGITSLEKNIGKKVFTELCGNYLIKPAGRPTVAAETDKRPAINMAQYKLNGAEFNDTETDEQ